MKEEKNILTIPSDKIKMYKCKLCKYKGTRKGVRKHIRENHLWQGYKSLASQVESYEFLV